MNYHVTCELPISGGGEEMTLPIIRADAKLGFVASEYAPFPAARTAAYCAAKNERTRCMVRDEEGTVLIAYNENGSEITWKEG